MIRRRPDDGANLLAISFVLIILLALAMMLAFCIAEPKNAYGQEPVVVRVGNFGKPMEPIAPAFTNDPERIVLSQNFYSNQPGARQTRNGTVSAFNFSSLTTQKVDAITTFGQQGDSAAIVFMAGGKWWYTFYGSYTAGKLAYVSSLATPREIKPYTPGTVTIADSLATMYTNSGPTHFSRHLQSGDTIFITGSLDTCIVRYVYGDTRLVVDTTNGLAAHIGKAWDATRSYSGSDPWLYASGKYVYTGSAKDPPQVIYNKDDTVFIRPLIMVDSFYVDKVISKYVDSTTDTPKAILRQSYQKAGDDSVLVETQLVSRRANWMPDQWLTSGTGSPVSYFVRTGWYSELKRNLGEFYTIRGNTDTSMYIASWYRDSVINGLSTAERDSLQPMWTDTLNDTDLYRDQHWAYIYTAVGNYDVILPDASTPVATLFGRGAIWKVYDPAPALIDTATFVNNLCFLHTTSDDISFPAYTAGYDVIYTYYVKRVLSSAWGVPGVPYGTPLTQDQLPITDTIMNYREESHKNGEMKPGRWLGWEVWGIWEVRSFLAKRPVQAQYVNDGYYPIRYARRIGDTLWFVTSAANIDMVADTSRDTTSQWEIVKVGMPSWGGMTSWGNPPQLAAWGDTSSSSLVSFAQPQDPWNWVASNDVTIGLDPSDPVVGLLGFDDQLLAFKRNSITGFKDGQLSEISQGDGLIARDALTSDNKFAYWLDVDGPKMISRRDFSGYTIQKIGAALDPVFNTWSAGFWGTSVVPFYMNPAYKDQAVLRYNEFDGHLYLFFAADSTTTNNRCLTYSVPRNEWDGLFTYGASAAMPFTWKDTSCILFGKNDTSMVMRTALTWSDNGTGITSQLKSGRFWITDKSGWPVEGHLTRMRFTGRGSDILLDSLQLVITVNGSMSGNVTTTAADSVTLDMATSISDGQFTWYPSSDLTGTYWEWKINVKGRSGGTLFAPYEMLFEFMPTSREK